MVEYVWHFVKYQQKIQIQCNMYLLFVHSVADTQKMKREGNNSDLLRVLKTAHRKTGLVNKRLVCIPKRAQVSKSHTPEVRNALEMQFSHCKETYSKALIFHCYLQL
jgi:hypothetical protein